MSLIIFLYWGKGKVKEKRKLRKFFYPAVLCETIEAGPVGCLRINISINIYLLNYFYFLGDTMLTIKDYEFIKTSFNYAYMRMEALPTEDHFLNHEHKMKRLKETRDEQEKILNKIQKMLINDKK